LLEKPAAPTPEECDILARAAEQYGSRVLVCHVLRYTPFFNALKSVIVGGKIGDVMNIQHIEGVGNLHQSHSFVRGNWGNSDRATPMILQKSCHDMDILQWLVGKKCLEVHSFGTLSYFRSENAPAGAPEFCIEGCPEYDSCPYNAVKLYYDDKKNNWFRSAAAKMHEPTDEAVLNAIKTTNYGRCVFRADNNVVDHQVVNLLFEDGVIASFTMSAFTKGGREIHIMGTKGELRAQMSSDTFTIYNFETRETEELKISDTVLGDSIVGGHGGGDAGIMRSLYDLLCGIEHPGLSTIDISVETHKIAFAAEISRLEGRAVKMSELE
jgi:predicted dehydrogenase